MTFKDYILKKNPEFLTEGAWTNQGLYWIEPSGKLHPLPKNMGHEEWANNTLNTSLEALLKRRWVRIQSLPGQYLYVDHRQKALSNSQTNVLLNFFFNKEMDAISYPKGYVVEKQGNDSKDFPTSETMEAFDFATKADY